MPNSLSEYILLYVMPYLIFGLLFILTLIIILLKDSSLVTNHPRKLLFIGLSIILSSLFGVCYVIDITKEIHEYEYKQLHAQLAKIENHTLDHEVKQALSDGKITAIEKDELSRKASAIIKQQEQLKNSLDAKKELIKQYS